MLDPLQPFGNGSHSVLPLRAATLMQASHASGMVMLVGTHVPAGITSGSWPTLEVYDGAGVSLGRPPGTWTFVSPRAGLDDDGMLHLMWGEPTADATFRRVTAHSWTQWQLQEVWSLWAAFYDVSRSAWSTPHRVLTATMLPLVWSSPTSSLITLPGGELATVVLQPSLVSGPGGQSNVGRSIAALLTWSREGHWRTQTVALPAGTMEVALGRSERDAYIGYVAPVSRTELAVSTLTRGASAHEWSSPVHIARRPTTTGFMSFGWASSSSSAALVWRESRPDERDALVVARPREASVWDTTPRLSVPHASGGETYALDDGRTLHLVHEVLQADRSLRIAHHQLGDGAVSWTSGMSFDLGIPAYAPRLHRTRSGPLRLTVAVYHAPPSTERRFVYVGALGPSSGPPHNA